MANREKLRNFDELKQEFEKNVKKLQRICRHKKSSWADEWWAIAHSTGYRVKVCDFCHKFLMRVKDKKSARLQKCSPSYCIFDSAQKLKHASRFTKSF